MIDHTYLLMDLRSENAAYRKMALPMARAVSSADDRLSTELLPCRHNRHECLREPVIRWQSRQVAWTNP